MGPILTQFVTRFYANRYFFIDRKSKFYLKCVLCEIYHFEFWTSLVSEGGNLPNQELAAFLGSPGPAIKLSDWLIKSNPARTC